MYRCSPGVLGGEPMNSPLHLSAVCRHTVSGFKVSCTVYLCDRAVRILYDLIAAHYIRSHESDLSARLHTEELRRRNLGKIVGINNYLSGKR